MRIPRSIFKKSKKGLEFVIVVSGYWLTFTLYLCVLDISITGREQLQKREKNISMKQFIHRRKQFATV